MRIIILAIILSSPLYAVIEPIILHGNEDNRVEVDQYPNPMFQDFARSVAMRVETKKLENLHDHSDFYDLSFLSTLGEVRNLCSDERFIEQPVLGDCSGFLVKDDVLVTAGHCMILSTDCQEYRWVFDFKEGDQEVSLDQVYECKEVLHTSFNGDDDYAIIKLKVKNSHVERKPLTYREVGIVEKGDSLVVIGHPLGLPMKITDGGEVLRNGFPFFRGKVFHTNLDTFVGNSGSPVFSQETGLVEGILIGGNEDDFLNSQNGCLSSNRISFEAGRERVFRITEIINLL